MQNDYGLWTLVIANTAVLAVFLLAFLRPTQRREWRSFGVVAAFLVALFTEMYGFPLTIYLLTWLLGRDPFPNPLAHMSGNLIASLLGLGTAWAGFFMFLGGVVILAGMGIVASGWRRIHRAQGALVTDGPYRVVRHPQYSGLMVMIAGTLIQWPTLLAVLMAPVLVVAYYRLARREEAVMLARFGATYRRYMAAVPMLVPRLGHPRRGRRWRSRASPPSSCPTTPSTGSTPGSSALPPSTPTAGASR